MALYANLLYFRLPYAGALVHGLNGLLAKQLTTPAWRGQHPPISEKN